MKTVPTDFRKNGWHYVQLKRVGNIAIYEQGGGAAYEVVRIRVKPACLFKGKPLPERECLPCDSKWGRDGFTCHTLERAEAKMAALVSADEQNPDFVAQERECGACQNQSAAA